MTTSLFDNPPAPATRRHLSIQERFEGFHENHPEIYELFQRFARELRDAGRSHYSADAILHRIRWEYDVNPRHDEQFKINDHFSSRYARLLIEDDASFEGFFSLRNLMRE